MGKYMCLIFLLLSCTPTQEELTGHDIEIFRQSPVWNLAKAVEKDDTVKISKLTGLYDLNYQEPFLGMTLLNWAIYNGKYSAAKVLINHGADPNKKEKNGETAVCIAAGIKETSDILKLLLLYGGDANVIANDSTAFYLTPLIAAAGARLESVQLLLRARVDTNFVSPQGGNALIQALIFEKMDIIKYLIIDCKVKLTISSKYKKSILFYFRTMTFPLNSDDYKLKMELVNYMKNNGLNYWDEPVPKYIQEKYSQEYLDKY